MRRPLLALGLLAACQVERLSVIATPPADIDLVALLFFDRDGVLVGATPLLDHAPGEIERGFYQRATPDVTRVALAGWSRAALGELLPEDQSAVGRVNLRTAGEGEPILPPPVWSAEGPIDHQRAMLEPNPLSIELTAPWLPLCPMIAPPDRPPLVDVRCADSPQHPVVFENEDCTIEIDLRSNGGLPKTTGRIDGRGRLIPDPGGCSPLSTSSEAAITIDCDNCGVDIYERLERKRITIAPPLELFPGSATYDGGRDGYVTELVVAGGAKKEIVAVTHGGRLGYASGCDTLPVELQFIDRETMMLGAAVDAPACLIKLAPVSGGGLIGLLAGPTPSLMRFDANGTELDRVPIVDSHVEPRHIPVQLAISADGLHVAVGWTALDDLTGSFVTVHALATLALEGVIEIEHPTDEYNNGVELLSIAALDADRVAVGTDPDARVYILALDASASLGWDRMAMSRDIAKTPQHISYAKERGSLLVTSSGYYPVVHIASAENAMWRDAASVYELEATPQIAAPWPGKPELALVAITALDGSRPITWLAMYDTVIVRFLPGALRVGAGRASIVRADPEGRLWILIPGSGTIVRVDRAE